MGGMTQQALRILQKDLRLEWRGRARLAAVVVFGIVTLILFSFAAGPDAARLASNAAGFLVLALLLSSTLSLSESFRKEHEDRALEGLLLLALEPAALFYGKASATALFLLLLAPILVPVALVLYTTDPSGEQILRLVAVWGLAAAGLAAPGTLYAGMTSRLESRDVLLPLLLFPLVVPVLMASVKAMQLVLHGDPMGQLRSWTLLLICFDVIYWSLGGILFNYAIEES